jgi:hypothetical protein
VATSFDWYVQDMTVPTPKQLRAKYVQPGKPFPASPLAAVNSPVDVAVNGKFAEVLAAVGLPGAVAATK